MNVFLKEKDAERGVITVEIEKNDYADKVEKALHKLRQKVNMPGFRKGMVPVNLVRKLYGQSALVEEVNNLLSEKLTAFIRDEVKILGQPINSEKYPVNVNFETESDFTFNFDVALAPEINVELTKDDSLTYETFVVDDAAIGSQIDELQRNFGYNEPAETVEEDDLVKGVLVELENGVPKEGGILVENAVLMPRYIKGKLEQKKFLKAAKESKVIFNPHKAFKGSEAEIASLLKIDSGDAKNNKNDFSFEIKEISRYVKPNLDQDFFDRIFGEGTVSDEASFRAKIGEMLTDRFARESKLKFCIDVRKFLIDKAGNVPIAEDILKRWLLASDEKLSAEVIDKEFPFFKDSLIYQSIVDKIIQENDIKIEDADVEDAAKQLIRMQLAAYGMLSVPDATITAYAKERLADKEAVKTFIDKAIDFKIAETVKTKITITEKEVKTEQPI